MPVTVNRRIDGPGTAGSALRAVQAFASRPVSNFGADTPQALEREIIAMQRYLSTVVAVTPSGFKFDPAKVNTSIDHQLLPAKLVEVQTAANL